MLPFCNAVDVHSGSGTSLEPTQFHSVGFFALPCPIVYIQPKLLLVSVGFTGSIPEDGPDDAAVLEWQWCTDSEGTDLRIALTGRKKAQNGRW